MIFHCMSAAEINFFKNKKVRARVAARITYDPNGIKEIAEIKMIESRSDKLKL